MKPIVSEFVNLIKGCSNGLALEKEIWQQESSSSARLSPRLWKPTMLNWPGSMRESRKSCGWIGAPCSACSASLLSPRGLFGVKVKSLFYPLDRVLGLAPYQRYSSLLLYSVTKVVAGSALPGCCRGSEHPDSVGHQPSDGWAGMVRTVGEKYAQYGETMRPSFSSDEPLEKPKYLFIEGDGVVMKGQPKNKVEMHRFQVASGVKQIGKEKDTDRTARYCRLITRIRKHVLELLDAYLENHNNLTQCTVLSNSDRGRGYTKDVFDKLAAGSRRHEHFRDRYHVNEKIRQRLEWVRKRGMVDRLHREVWKHDWEGVHCCQDMLEGEASNAEEEENVRKLQAYLERNWECLTPLAMREGLEDCQKGLGTCESNHRTYTYRMKKQGWRWSCRGWSGDDQKCLEV